MADRRPGWGGMLREAADRTVRAAQGALENRVGYTVVPREDVELKEALLQDNRVLSRNLDLLGYGVLDAMSANPHEVKAKKRVESARQARMAWMWDPMAGSAIDLMNDFVFGKGVPAPTARDPDVQKVIDAAWNDADNVAALTGYQAQVALGTDLGIQSNLYVLIFADGDDGKVKLSMLDHDTVFDAVRDPENRLRVLYYVATFTEQEWDFNTDSAKITTGANMPQVRYYAHWKNVQDAEDDIANGLRDRDSLPQPPKEKIGDGVVYHIAVNRTSEMVFGVPAMQRAIRWFSAYNDLMSARVDMAKAAAELIMKRKVKGSPNALQKLAQSALAGGGEIATPISPTRIGGGPAGTVIENENVTHDKFNLDSGAANATVDATMIRSQVSAATRFPQHYLGDQGNANLATATAMELPVTKMVESRQELFEQLFRAFTDIAIRRAVEAGQLTGVLPGEEDTNGDAQVTKQDSLNEAGDEKPVNKGLKLDGSPDNAGVSGPSGKQQDLGYDFKMPNALRRLMTDLATAIQTIAKTFDPNGTNIELARTLLTIALGDALEVQDVADAVNRIFPPGYQDPLVKMELETGQAGLEAGGPQSGLQQRGGDAPPAPQGDGGPGSGQASPNGNKNGATAPEDVEEAFRVWMAENPDELRDALARLVETRFKDMPHESKQLSDDRGDGMAEAFAQIVGSVADDVVDALPVLAGSTVGV